MIDPVCITTLSRSIRIFEFLEIKPSLTKHPAIFPTFEIENTAPVLGGASIYPTEPSSQNSLSVSIESSDIDGDELEFSFESEENAILYFEDNILNIIPDENYFGQLLINVIVSDNILNTFSEFILDVLPVNDPP